MGCASSTLAKSAEADGPPPRPSRSRRSSDAYNIGSPMCPATTMDMARMKLRPIQSANGKAVPVEDIRHMEHPQEIRGAMDFLRVDEPNNGNEIFTPSGNAANPPNFGDDATSAPSGKANRKSVSGKSTSSISAQPPSDTSSTHERVTASQKAAASHDGTVNVNAKGDEDYDFAAVGPACNSSTAVLHAVASGYEARRRDDSSFEN